MSYASQQDLVDRFGEDELIQLTDRETPPAGAIDATVVERALAGADALIDGHLKRRYRLPLVATPPLVRDLALPITFYLLHRNSASDKVTEDYNTALRTLRDISTGTVQLDVAGVEPEASGATGVRVNDRERDMTPDNLKGFV